MLNGIKLTEITKGYGSFKLDKVSMTLPSGYIMGLIGENGAGKTTLIKILLGLIGKDAGEVQVFDRPFDAEDSDIREHIGVVMDECSFPEDMTTTQLDKVMASCYRTWDREAFAMRLDDFDIPKNKKIKTFSKGMKMKLSIAQALSHDSKLLVLDEATAGLDPVVREEVLDILQEFIQDEDRSVLISSHILSDLEKICDYITFIHKGQVLISDSKDSMLERYAIVRCGKENFEAIDKAAIVAVREGMFGMEVLALRDIVNPALITDGASIEDIMVFLIKEEKR